MLTTPVSLLFKLIVMVLYTIILFFFFFPSTRTERWRETLLLMHSSTIGFLFSLSTGNFLLIYLALELSTIGLYVLTVLGTESERFEGGIKYFLSNCFISGFSLVGIYTVYEIFATLNVVEISLINGFPIVLEHSENLHFALALLLSYHLFKAAVVPFHLWTADVYQNTSPVIIAYFAIVPKCVAFYHLFFLLGIFPGAFHFLSNALFTIGCLSLIVGTFSVFSQINLKCLFAYTSVSHSGMILILFSFGTFEATLVAILYFFFYCYMALSFLLVLHFAIQTSPKGSFTEIKDLAFLYQRHSFLHLLLSSTLLSFAGIPPLVGFFSKYYFMDILFINGSYFTLFLFLVCSTLSAVYYFKLMMIIWSSYNSRHAFVLHYTPSQKFFLMLFLVGLFFLPVLLFPFFKYFILIFFI